MYLQGQGQGQDSADKHPSTISPMALLSTCILSFKSRLGSSKLHLLLYPT